MLKRKNTVKSCAIKSPHAVLSELKLNADIAKQAELNKKQNFKRVASEK